MVQTGKATVRGDFKLGREPRLKRAMTVCRSTATVNVVVAGNLSRRRATLVLPPPLFPTPFCRNFSNLPVFPRNVGKDLMFADDKFLNGRNEVTRKRK
jgi:hypothetical protein